MLRAVSACGSHPTMGEIYSYKGENINGYDPNDRAWDPQRLLDGYWHSCATLNYLRGLQMGPCAHAEPR
jgi:3-deoxy-D-arabino-heptulosonate 7-phosphate (DAHP) synthase class II